MKGRIVDIRFDTTNTIYLKQGVKGKDQYRYDRRYPGGTEPMQWVAITAHLSG